MTIFLEDKVQCIPHCIITQQIPDNQEQRNEHQNGQKEEVAEKTQRDRGITVSDFYGSF